MSSSRLSPLWWLFRFFGWWAQRLERIARCAQRRLCALLTSGGPRQCGTLHFKYNTMSFQIHIGHYRLNRTLGTGSFSKVKCKARAHSRSGRARDHSEEGRHQDPQQAQDQEHEDEREGQARDQSPQALQAPQHYLALRVHRHPQRHLRCHGLRFGGRTVRPHLSTRQGTLLPSYA